jgi:hypothetical protein
VFVYGSGFGEKCNNYFRSVFLKNEEETDLMFNELEDFIKKRIKA